jgi:hypothetical protein
MSVQVCGETAVHRNTLGPSSNVDVLLAPRCVPATPRRANRMSIDASGYFGSHVACRGHDRTPTRATPTTVGGRSRSNAVRSTAPSEDSSVPCDRVALRWCDPRGCRGIHDGDVRSPRCVCRHMARPSRLVPGCSPTELFGPRRSNRQRSVGAGTATPIGGLRASWAASGATVRAPVGSAVRARPPSPA